MVSGWWAIIEVMFYYCRRVSHHINACHYDVMYAGTRGGAIVAVDADKMIIHGVMCVQSSPVKPLVMLKQRST